MKNYFAKMNRFYLFNFAIISLFALVVVSNFLVQFKVESLQENVRGFELQISDHKKQLNSLEIEWTYLTRPSRLRALADEYLQDTGYSVASQIKSGEEMKQFFANNHDKSLTQHLALVE